MEARLLTPADSEQATALATAHGSVYYSAEWMAIHGSGLKRYGVFDDGGEMAGAFGVFHERRAGVTIVRNPPYTPVCGPVIRVKALHGVKVLETRRKVVDAMAALLEGERFKIVSLALDHLVDDTIPFLARGFKVVPCYTYTVDLTRPLPDIVRGFTPTRRNDISKARRDGLVVRETTDLGIVSDLVHKTMRRQRARSHDAVLDRMLGEFARPHNSYALVTYKGTTPIACLFVIHDRATAYYVLGGYDREDKHHGAGAVALQEAITRAKELGLRTFDFEGSTLPPIERFFRGFGGRLVHYFTVNRAWLPFEMSLKLFRRNLF